MTRIRLTLSEDQWEYLDSIKKHGELLTQFWRVALGMSEDEFAAAPEKSVVVQDYEVSKTDHERLHGMLRKRAKDRHERQRVAMLWLDIGPCEGED